MRATVYGQHRTGTVIPVEIAISKIKLDGAVELTAVVRDISDRVQLMELLRKQAATDVLTGLPNRREFLQDVDEMLDDDMPLSIFILDIDSFKNINDRYSHDIGDEVLRVLGNVGTAMLYDGKLFARWGGEAFVAMLPSANSDLALRVAEAFRGRIETHDFEFEWSMKPILFTVIIGLVTRQAGENSVDTLMRRADPALYEAKAAGRNRVQNALLAAQPRSAGPKRARGRRLLLG
jgi:diguanylate cyclase (GGDEF)-like protein